MGLWNSKNSSKNNNKNKIQLNNIKSDEQQDDYEVDNPNKYDQVAIQNLKKDLNENPETFILNLMLMSVMFFDDFQEEMRVLANTVSEKGKNLNTKLIQEHQKQFLIPDAIMDCIDKRVKFESDRGILEPLVPQRMYILHDTIEIIYRDETVDYIGIDKPSYRAIIEESKANKGFVKVNLLGTSGLNCRRNSIDSACSTTPTKLYYKKDEISSPQGTSNDSGVNSESDYDYLKITAARTPKKLQITEKDIYTRISQLPSKCIKPIRVKNELSDSETETEDDEDEEEEQRNRKSKRNPTPPPLFLTHYYLNSNEFMKHFKDNVFPNHLGEVLGFRVASIEHATYIPGAIFCDKLESNHNTINYEIIPAIAMPWPEEIAYEWLLRRRITVRDKRTQIAYKWPTDNMVREAKRLNCVVIPKGFMPKRDENPIMDIEWEVGFPKAERYLEIRMSHAQIRMFLYIITIFRAFIEPKTHKRGLLIEHIRILMFWECEGNYKAWPEDKLGTKLKLILQKLYDHLSKQQLPHYFIRSKNVLRNVPGRECRCAQDTIHKVLESPVLYLLSALKKLKYTSSKFYTELDFTELYMILTSDEALKKANPGMHKSINIHQQTKKFSEHKKRNKYDKEQEWNKRYQEQQKLKRVKELNRKTMESENLSDDERHDSEFIDVNLPLKDFKNNVFRQALLLEYFIDHFLKIARKSLKLCSTTQTTRFYLKQAWYLTKLLEFADIEKARKYQNYVSGEEENCGRRAAIEVAIPSTPKRNSTPLMVVSPEILQVKSKEINIHNLTKSYNANILMSEPKIVTNPNIKTKIKTKQAEGKITVEVHKLHSSQKSKSDESINKNSYTSGKEITKSISFRLQKHTDVNEIKEVESEVTNL